MKGKKIADLPIEKCYLNNQFYFSELKKLEKFKKIITVDDNNDIEVKNGVATNLDSLFFSDNHNGWGTKKAYKISKGEYTNVIFPYDNNYNLVSIDKIKEKNYKQYNLLLKNKNSLLLRNLQGQEWYAFARNQAIKDTHIKKLVINNIVRNIENLKLQVINEDVVVYSGYYIMSKKYSYKNIIKCIRTSEFIEYLKIIGKDKNGNRSSNKVNNLHGIISKHLQKQLGIDYLVKTIDTTGKEEILRGRYFNKRVDIVIERNYDKKRIAGISLKSIQSSYLKNKINYFENMLGETANIRSNNIPYFQIIIIPTKIPNFNKDGAIKDFTNISEKDFEIYKKLSSDNVISFFHTPIKTLLLFIEYEPDIKINSILTKSEYSKYYIDLHENNFMSIKFSNKDMYFDKAVIFNNYELFIEKVTFLLKGFA